MNAAWRESSPEEWEQASQMADFVGLVDQLRDWADAAPAWEPLRRGRRLVDRCEPELRKVQFRGDAVLVVGFIGGTGVGKSTLINALVGEAVCPAGKEQRPTTTRPTVVCAPGVDVSFLGLDAQHLTVHERDLPLLEHMLLVDCPDPDTQEPTGADGGAENHNRDIMRQVLPHCDVMVCVATGQKYRSQIVTEELLRHAPGRCVVFVQSHADRDDDLREHWRQTLVEWGFDVPQIFRLDSVAALAAAEKQQPAAADFHKFKELLQNELASRARRRIQRANVLGLCAWLIARVRGWADAAEPELSKLETTIAREQTALRDRIRRRLTEYLRGNGYLWRSKLLDEVSARWGWGLLASFFRVLSGLGTMLFWIPLARARSMTQLVVAGTVAAAGTGKAALDQFRRQQALAPPRDLGIGPSDLAQARGILESQAAVAGLADAIESHRGQRREQFTEQTLDELSLGVQRRLDEAVEIETRRRVAQRAGKVHGLFELLFILLPCYLVGRLGYNFFYEHLWLREPLLPLNFILYGFAWVVVIGWLLRAWLLGILGFGLRRHLIELVDRAISDSLLAGLSADLTDAIDRSRRSQARLAALQAELTRLQCDMGHLSELGVGVLQRSANGRAGMLSDSDPLAARQA